MKSGIFFAVLALTLMGASPRLAKAQQVDATNPPLNDQQANGRRVFQQRCAVCHTRPFPGAKQYGPVLHKVLVTGNESMIHTFIMNGSKGKMPAFKYTLESKDIDAIVEYLKTLPPPPPPTGESGGDNQQID